MKQAEIDRIAAKRLRIHTALRDCAALDPGDMVTAGDCRRALSDAYEAGARDEARRLDHQRAGLERDRQAEYERGYKAAALELRESLDDWLDDHGIAAPPPPAVGNVAAQAPAPCAGCPSRR